MENPVILISLSGESSITFKKEFIKPSFSCPAPLTYSSLLSFPAKMMQSTGKLGSLHRDGKSTTFTLLVGVAETKSLSPAEAETLAGKVHEETWFFYFRKKVPN